MTINEQLEELFQEWQKSRNYSGFFKDGIMGEQNWKDKEIKIMFLLKENYSDGWRINDKIDIRRGTNKKFFPNLARWKYLVDNIKICKKVLNYPTDKELEDFQKGWDMYDVAYVNVKKSIGKSTSDDKEIQKFAKEDKDFLTREIDIINPNIVICGKTFRSYRCIYNENEKIVKITDKIYKHKNRIIIDFYHPGWWQCKGGQEALYNKLKNIVNKENIIEMITNQPT